MTNKDAIQPNRRVDGLMTWTFAGGFSIIGAAISYWVYLALFSGGPMSPGGVIILERQAPAEPGADLYFYLLNSEVYHRSARNRELLDTEASILALIIPSVCVLSGVICGGVLGMLGARFIVRRKAYTHNKRVLNQT